MCTDEPIDVGNPTSASQPSQDLLPAATDAPPVSLLVVARKRIPELDRLVGALREIDGPPQREIIVAVETPGTTTPTETRDAQGVRWIAIPARRGLGYNRNRAFEAARGEIVFGIDDDCVPQPEWLTSLLDPFADPDVHGAVGSICIPAAGFLGDSISALGFPAGGTAGYATMFRVDPDGTTDNIAAGNCALRAATLRELGGFDESLTFGGEDTELAHRFNLAGRRIVFVPGAAIMHPARTSLREFIRWLFVRGRAKRQFSRKVPIGKFVGLRLKSMGHILQRHATDPKIVLIAPLLAATLVIQQAGFLAEAIAPTLPRTGE